MRLTFDRPLRVDRSGPRGTVSLAGRGVEIRLEGIAAEQLPATLPSLILEEITLGSPRELSLRAGSALYPVQVRHWRVHEGQPNFYTESLARHSPSTSERWAARLLVAAAGLPGAAALYRLWHARRSR
jgi:hypothetical protein